MKVINQPLRPRQKASPGCEAERSPFRCADQECFMGTTLQASAPRHDVREKVLVRKVKAFLKQRLQRLAPDAVLTHAWDSFYRIYTNILRRMAAEFHLDAGESEDLVQEVWAQVIVHLPEFE